LVEAVEVDSTSGRRLLPRTCRGQDYLNLIQIVFSRIIFELNHLQNNNRAFFAFYIENSALIQIRIFCLQGKQLINGVEEFYIDT